MKKIILLNILFASILSLTSFPDKITLNNDKVIDGIIKEESNDKIIIIYDGSELIVPKSNIKNIEKAAVAANEDALSAGDKFFAEKNFLAAIKEYRKIEDKSPDIVKNKIEQCYSIIKDSILNEISQSSLDDSERKTRGELKNTNLTNDEINLLNFKLAQILMKKSEQLIDRANYESALASLEEAYNISPDSPNLIYKYVDLLTKTKKPEDKIISALKSYIQNNPNDYKSIKLLSYHNYKKEPFEVVKILYLNKTLLSNADIELKNIAADALILCYNSKPYPENFIFDKVQCYEQYLLLKPQSDKAPLYIAKIEKEPQKYDNYYDFAIYLEGQNKKQDALNVYERISQLFPGKQEIEEKKKVLISAILKENIDKNIVEIKQAQTIINKASSLTMEDFPISKLNDNQIQSQQLSLKEYLSKSIVLSNTNVTDENLKNLENYKTKTLEYAKIAEGLLKISESEKQKTYEATKLPGQAGANYAISDAQRKRAEQIIRELEDSLATNTVLRAMSKTGKIEGPNKSYTLENVVIDNGKIISCKFVKPFVYDYRK